MTRIVNSTRDLYMQLYNYLEYADFNEGTFDDLLDRLVSDIVSHPTRPRFGADWSEFFESLDIVEMANNIESALLERQA